MCVCVCVCVFIEIFSIAKYSALNNPIILHTFSIHTSFQVSLHWQRYKIYL